MSLQRPQTNRQLSCFFNTTRNIELSVLYLKESFSKYLRQRQNIWDIQDSTYSNSTQRENNYIYFLLKCLDRSIARTKGNFCLQYTCYHYSKAFKKISEVHVSAIFTSPPKYTHLSV